MWGEKARRIEDLEAQLAAYTERFGPLGTISDQELALAKEIDARVRGHIQLSHAIETGEMTPAQLLAYDGTAYPEITDAVAQAADDVSNHHWQEARTKLYEQTYATVLNHRLDSLGEVVQAEAGEQIAEEAQTNLAALTPELTEKIRSQLRHRKLGEGIVEFVRQLTPDLLHELLPEVAAFRQPEIDRHQNALIMAEILQYEHWLDMGNFSKGDLITLASAEGTASFIVEPSDDDEDDRLLLVSSDINRLAGRVGQRHSFLTEVDDEYREMITPLLPLRIAQKSQEYTSYSRFQWVSKEVAFFGLLSNLTVNGIVVYEADQTYTANATPDDTKPLVEDPNMSWFTQDWLNNYMARQADLPYNQ